MRGRVPIAPAVLVACVIVAVVAVTACVRSCAAPGNSKSIVAEVASAARVARATAQMQLLDERGTYDLNPDDLLSIPNSSDVVAVNLAGQPKEVPESALAEVNDALDAIREGYRCGFVFLDVGTGRGLACNAGEEMYIASAAKAPLSLYAIQHGAALTSDERQSIEEAILYSDNDAFEAFAYSYTNEEYASWLEAHGVYHEAYGYDLYPPMSARSLASFWAEILLFMQDDSDSSQWFAGLLSSTETSFIRDALDDEDAHVMNKGGWIAEEGYESVSDASIIEAGGHVYIMAIVTDQPDGGQAEWNVTALARALFNMRKDM